MLLTGLLCGILLGFVMQRGRFVLLAHFAICMSPKITKCLSPFYWRLPCNPSVSFSSKEIGVFKVDPAENFAF